MSQGTNIPLADSPVSAANYQANIAQALGVSAARAAAIAAEYPPGAHPDVAFSLLVSDASFACPALQVDRWTAARGVPTYAYQFNDDNAPVSFLGKRLGSGDARGRTPVSVRPAEHAGRARPRPAGARRQHADGLGPLRRDRQPVVARTALAVVQRNSGAVARAVAVAGHDRLRHRGTTAHSGPPGNDTPAAAHPSGCRADERGSRKG